MIEVNIQQNVIEVELSHSVIGAGGGGTVDSIVAGTNIEVDNTDPSNPIVGTTDSPEFDYIDLNNAIANPSHKVGRLFYDQDTDSVSYYNAENDTTVNLGQEFLIRVRNETGATIPNGAVVYPSGVSVSGQVLVDYADASERDKSRLVAMVTADIENNTEGYVTRLGTVNGVDTTGFGVGNIVYLSPNTPGALTTTRPIDGSYAIIIGAIKRVAVDGAIIVDINIPDLTVEVTDTNGFPVDQRTNTIISIDDLTRTFTIAPVSARFHFYEMGDKYEKYSSDSIVISDVEGSHIIYYHLGVLSELVNGTGPQIEDIILNHSTVAYIYWDSTNQESIYVGDERHGISMSPTTHVYLHLTRSAQYLRGLALNTISADGSGDLDIEAKFGIDAGAITDEDLRTEISTLSSTTGLPIFYLTGATPYLRRAFNPGFSVLTTGSGRLAYNQFTGGAWQITEVGNTDHALCHVFASSDIEYPLFAIMGQNTYSSTGNARAGANNEISSLRSIIPLAELVPIATIIYQTNNGYDNAVKSRIRTTDEGNLYVDWRVTELAQGASPTDHGNLANLQLAQATVMWGHIDDQPQTIAGKKTFSDGISFLSASENNLLVADGSGGLKDTGVDYSDTWIIDLSDETTDLEAGTSTVTMTIPYDCTINAIQADVVTAPTGSALQVDINENATSIFSTEITIDAGGTSSATATTPAVISDSTLTKDNILTFDIDQVGASVPGTGLKIRFNVTRT